MRLTATVAVLSLSAFAVAAPTAKPREPGFSTLPAARIGPRPARSSTPSEIRAEERAPWFALAGHQGPLGLGEAPSLLFLSASESAAQSYQRDPSRAEPNGCFVVEQMHMPSGGADWPLIYEAHPSLTTHQGVVPARYERLSVKPGGATLTLADAWIDARSRGVRSIGRVDVPLVSVARGPRGIQVYAARQGRMLHFVVTPARTDGVKLKPNLGSRVMGTLVPGSRSHREQVLTSMARSMSITRSDGASGRSDCGHARVSLSADTGGQAATISTDVLLPARPDEGEGELRLRSLEIDLSVSQLSGDRQPIYSVSFGWRGQTRTLPL